MCDGHDGARGRSWLQINMQRIYKVEQIDQRRPSTLSPILQNYFNFPIHMNVVGAEVLLVLFRAVIKIFLRSHPFVCLCRLSKFKLFTSVSFKRARNVARAQAAFFH